MPTFPRHVRPKARGIDWKQSLPRRLSPLCLPSVRSWAAAAALLLPGGFTSGKRMSSVTPSEETLGSIDLEGRGERELASPRDMDAPFRMLVESVVDYAIFLIDLRGRIATWNTGAQHI